jgi:hypothetical protein
MIEKDDRVVRILDTIDKRPFLQLSKMMEKSLLLLRSNSFPRPTSKAIIAARAKLANDRSELIFYRLEILKELSLLKGSFEDLSNYIVSKYVSYFNNMKNQKNRDAIIKRVLNPINKKIRKLESSLDIINNTIADFDSKSFAIRDVVEALKLGEREV